MADTLITAPAVPLKLFYVRLIEKDEAGSVTRVVFADHVIAASAEASKLKALASMSSIKLENVDIGRLAVNVGEVISA